MDFVVFDLAVGESWEIGVRGIFVFGGGVWLVVEGLRLIVEFLFL